jgi:hypothetical protein
MIVSSSGGDFKPIPEGAYLATCVRIIDLGTQITSFQGADKLQRKVLLVWEVPDEIVEYEGEKRPALIMQRYTASLSDKANLRKHLEAWRGRRFTDDELRGFDLKNVLGKPCQIQVVHSENGGNVYANLAAIMALPKGTPAPDIHHPLIHFSLDEGEFSVGIYDGLSDKLKAQIATSPEYKARTGQTAPRPSERGGGGQEHFPADLDDEIPFITCRSIW